jgi:hypothetical protein
MDASIFFLNDGGRYSRMNWLAIIIEYLWEKKRFSIVLNDSSPPLTMNVSSTPKSRYPITSSRSPITAIVPLESE